jgi:hypothetical protein
VGPSVFKAQPGPGARLEKLPEVRPAWQVPLVRQALKEQVEVQVSKAAAPSVQAAQPAKPVPQALKVESERRALKARR